MSVLSRSMLCQVGQFKFHASHGGGMCVPSRSNSRFDFFTVSSSSAAAAAAAAAAPSPLSSSVEKARRPKPQALRLRSTTCRGETAAAAPGWQHGPPESLARRSNGRTAIFYVGSSS